MDEYHCNAYPNNFELATENSPCPSDDLYFNVEVEYTNMYVLNAREFHTHCETTHHRFCNISKEKIMQEETIESWLLNMDVPNDAFNFVVAKILDCARDMANRTTKEIQNRKVLSMRVDLVVTRASEDETDEDDDGADGNAGFEELEEDECGLVPAAMSSIEGLEMVTFEKEGFLQGNCAICFENFDVGVRMPCLHMFHGDCISSWLQVGNSCPLCRFQMPIDEQK